MNKNHLIAILVLLIAVVGLTMGSVAAGSTTKTKYKKTVLKLKFDKITSKKIGKYEIAAQKKKTSKYDIVTIAVSKKNKVMKGNKFYTKLYYKNKKTGKNKVTKWNKGFKKYNYQLYTVGKHIKTIKVGVKFPVN